MGGPEAEADAVLCQVGPLGPDFREAALPVDRQARRDPGPDARRRGESVGGFADLVDRDLDISALGSAGSLDIPLGQIEQCELTGLFKTMAVTYRDAGGTQAASTFAPKNGGMPDGPAWVEAIIQARNGRQ